MVTLIFKSQIFIIKNGSHCLVETHVKNADSHINFILLKKKKKSSDDLFNKNPRSNKIVSLFTSSTQALSGTIVKLGTT